MAGRKPPQNLTRRSGSSVAAANPQRLERGFDRALASLQRFAAKAVAMFDGVAQRLDFVSVALERVANAADVLMRIVRDIKDLGVMGLMELVRLLGLTAFAVNQLSTLLSSITTIPLGIVAAGLTTVAAAILAAVVPTAAWSVAWSTVLTGFGVLQTAAVAGLPVLVGWLTSAASAAWALVAPLVAAAAPVLAIAAAAGVAYAAMFKWQDIPGWLKVIMLAASPLVLVIRGIATACDLAARAFSVVAAVGRAAWSAISTVAAVALLPVTALRIAVTGVSTALTAVPELATAAGSALGASMQLGARAVRELGAAMWNFGERYVRPVVTLFANMASAGARRLQDMGAAVDAVASRIRGWSDTLRGLAGRVLDPLSTAGDRFAAAGTKLATLAAATGLSVSAVAGLGYAAERSGSSVESFAAGVATMQATLDDMARRADGQPLADLGLNLAALHAAAAETRFMALAGAINKLGDPLARAAAAERFFGAAGAGLLPLLERGPGQLAALRAEAARLGLVMDGPAAAAATAMTMALQTVRDASAGLWQTLGRAVAPALTETAQRTADVIKSVTAWVRANQPLIAQVFRIATTVATTATALGALATVVGSIGAALTAAGGVLAAVSAAIATLGGVLVFALTPAALLAAALGAIATAFGVVIPLAAGLTGAVALASAAWSRFGAAATSAAGSVRAALIRINADAQRVLGGIRSALAAGDLAGAATIGLLGVQKAWADGLRFIADLSGGVLGGILQSLSAGDWRGSARQAVTALQLAFTQGVDVLDSLWTGLEDRIGQVVLFMRQSLNEAIQQIAQFAMSALGKISELVNAVSEYDPTGALANAHMRAVAKLPGSALANAANTSPVAANAALAMDAGSAAAKRNAALAQRAAARQTEIIQLREQLIGQQLGARAGSDAAASQLEDELAAAIAAAEGAAALVRLQGEVDQRRQAALAGGIAAANERLAPPGAAAGGLGATFSGAALKLAAGAGGTKVEKAVEATAGNTAKLVDLERKRARDQAAMQLRFTA